MLEKIWKDIENFSNYQVSNFGEIRNKITLKILKPVLKRNGYLYINLGNTRKGNCSMFTIHHLVAKTFIPNMNNYPCINHKDENKQNNFVDNLEWCTYKYNNNYGTLKERQSAIQKGRIVSEETRIKLKNINLGLCPTPNGKYRLNGGKGCIYVYPEEIEYYLSLGYKKSNKMEK